MLMAHSVEGRFPFLDADVVALANSLPPHYKLRVLDEKHVLKRASAGLVPPEILARKKQPYRAPDALSFVGLGEGGKAPGSGPFAYLAEVMSEEAIRRAGVFEASGTERLWQKCNARANEAQFSNADNMAVVGVLSTQLLYEQFIRTVPKVRSIPIKTLVDRLAE